MEPRCASFSLFRHIVNGLLLLLGSWCLCGLLRPVQGGLRGRFLSSISGLKRVSVFDSIGPLRFQSSIHRSENIISSLSSFPSTSLVLSLLKPLLLQHHLPSSCRMSRGRMIRSQRGLSTYHDVPVGISDADICDKICLNERVDDIIPIRYTNTSENSPSC